MKKWISISEYSEMTGMKPSSIKNLIKTGALSSTKTDGGGKIMIPVESQESDEVAKLDSIDRKLEALCKHLGINTLN